MHEGMPSHFGSNIQASSRSPGANPRAYPPIQKPQAVLPVTRTVASIVGVGAAGDARQLASRFPPAATADAGLAPDDDAVAAEPAIAQARTNSATAGRARCSCVFRRDPFSPKLRQTVEFTEVTPGCRHHLRAIGPTHSPRSRGRQLPRPPRDDDRRRNGAAPHALPRACARVRARITTTGPPIRQRTAMRSNRGAKRLLLGEREAQSRPGSWNATTTVVWCRGQPEVPA